MEGLVMEAQSDDDWSFKNIDSERARRLGAAKSPNALIKAVECALRKGIESKKIKIGLDCRQTDQGTERRAIVQFEIDSDIYDWFFNARTGYRAQFWVSPETGTNFNRNIISALKILLETKLPQDVEVRLIQSAFDGHSREDYDVGGDTVPRDSIIKSLDPSVSKIWICERKIRNDTGMMQDFSLALFRGNDPHLCVPRWKDIKNPNTRQIGEGQRAPYPDKKYAWLDLKGGFVSHTGKVNQPKSPACRARISIFEDGPNNDKMADNTQSIISALGQTRKSEATSRLVRCAV